MEAREVGTGEITGAGDISKAVERFDPGEITEAGDVIKAAERRKQWRLKQ